MRVLDVWYDAIDIDRFLEVVGDEARDRAEARLTAIRKKNTPEFLFPKFVQEAGATPRIADDPPLIFHPSPEDAPGVESNCREDIADYRASLPEHLHTLFDRYRFCDIAMKVVGVGSVGTTCALALFMASDDDPIFLQVKEAGASVLEPYVGKSAHSHNGQRVVVGQRRIQAASDMFLGWATGANGQHLYLRQLRDMKVSVLLEDFSARDLRAYGRACGWALARAHARSGDAAMISGYMGSSEVFDDAICDFAVAYADQAESDHKAFVKAIREGQIRAIIEP
jgi:uncharacterized protein (DUF2252 family)